MIACAGPRTAPMRSWTRGRRTRSRRPGGAWRPITNSSRSPASPTRGPTTESRASRCMANPSLSKKRGVVWTPFCQLLALSPRGRRGRSRRCCSSRRCPGISPRCCAARSGRCCAIIRSSSPTGSIPRNVKLERGNFTLEDYTQHLIDFIGFIGEDCHVVAVCQPTVSALAATAVLAQNGSNIQPASLTLMAGPIDARVAPTKVNELAQEKPIEWFREQHDRRRAGQV